MKLIRDLGTIFPKLTSNRKRRFGIYECPFCESHFKCSFDSIKVQKSCGCQFSTLRKSQLRKHGFSHTDIYKVWKSIKGRCLNENNKHYDSYGGRGIVICDEWINSPELFIKWSLENGYESGLSIDRIDNDGNYEPKNCRYTTQNVQSSNTRKIRSNNTSGYRGVSYSKKHHKFSVQVGVNGKYKWIGYFKIAKDGAIAYDKYVKDNDLPHTLNFT